MSHCHTRFCLGILHNAPKTSAPHPLMIDIWKRPIRLANRAERPMLLNVRSAFPPHHAAAKRPAPVYSPRSAGDSRLTDQRSRGNAAMGQTLRNVGSR